MATRTGTNSGETLTGTSGQDILIGLGGNDVLNGLGGNDVLIGGTGGDQLNGGAGIDTASYETATSGVRAALADATIVTGDAAGDSYNSIENLKGSAFGDVLGGDAGNNTINGLDGNDALFGREGNDALNGGAGDDELSGGTGRDNLIGGAGDDELHSRQENNSSPVNSANSLADTDANEIGGTLDGAGGDDIITVSHDFHGTMTIQGGLPVAGAEGDRDLLRFAGDAFVLLNPGTATNRVDLEAHSGTTPFGSAMNIFNIDDVYGSNTYRDVFRGDNLANALRGFGGSDRLEGRGGADTLDGGAGIDVADYSSSLGVNVDLVRATQTTADAQGDVLIGIEEIDGSLFADTLRGNSGANYLFGNSGSDRLEGRAGADTLNGGNGIDAASYQSSNAAVTVTLNNSGGADVSFGGHAHGDVLISIENLIGSSFSDTLGGNSAGNTIEGGMNGADRLFGNGGTDVLRGGIGVDELTGGAGNDRLDGGFDGDFLDGSDGSDTVEYKFATRGVHVQLGNNGEDGKADADQSKLLGNFFEDILRSIENVTGSDFNDTIFGNEQANVLKGMSGDDYIGGDFGADTINGGNGIDSVDYGASPDGIVIRLNGSAGTGGFASGDRLSNIDNVGGSSFVDVITGNFGANSLQGNGGDDTLDGSGGADVLKGGNGADDLIGGSGSDTASYSGSPQVNGLGVTAKLANAAQNTGFAAGDTYSSIENLLGSNFNDILEGNSGANTINGGVGADDMKGLGGNDTYVVNLAADSVSEAGEGGADLVLASVSYTLALGAEIEQLATTDAAGTSTINLTGNGEDQTITGNAGVNTINGGGGDDTMIGGLRNDTYVVGQAGDTVIEQANQGTDLVRANVTHTLADNVENLELFGSDNINGLGNEAGNIIVGNTGNNLLLGREGNDTLTGGEGDDNFFFTTALDPLLNVDTITDFNPDDDTIRLDDALFPIGVPGAIDEAAFFIGPAAHDADDRIIYNSDNGALIFDSNGDAAGGATLFARLDAGLDLTRQDIFLF